ncbi:response regulator [Aurantibacter crassamenti]|uniref:ATP-binding protein n=1 Tax=Aurantibacter crassamenti TaxID=1837375 RepID=UPI001939D35C|nr:ATP-binding protein [Aurantibacter crassamenti]MBM1107089.1 response regulator [Aurantibacter crassamenti]
MKTNNLLSLLKRMESTLGEFSFDELTSQEATYLKDSFQSFKNDLQNKVNGHESIQVDVSERAESNEPNFESNLIANVSHEIRTPLNGIIGFTDLLKESQLNTEQLLNVNAIQKASNTLLELVNELLEYSKLASGKEQFQEIDFNIFSLTNDVIFLCNTLIVDKKVNLTSAIKKEIPKFLIGDPSKLTQVLLNTIGNAIKFVDDGEVSLNISIAKQSSDNIRLQFEIQDNGIGISQDKINQIFNPYVQGDADTSARYGGTGLGLNIVQQIVKNLGGTICIQSKLGIGTTVQFEMPFSIGNQNLQPIVPKKTKVNSSALESVSGLNILVFEDNELNKQLMQKRLDIWNCNMHITEKPEFGINVLENHAIDLILMDLRMPIMSGFEITKLIRTHNSLRIRQIPIIAVTADYTIQDQEKCNSFGINDYLLKPFSPEELLAKMVVYKNGYNMPKENKNNTQISKQNLITTDKPVDLTILYDQCDGSLELLKNLISILKNNVIEFKSKAKASIHDKDIAALAFSAHKIKGGVAMIQANILLKTIVEIQNGCTESPDFKHLEFLLSRFNIDYIDIEKAIDMAFDKLNSN